MGANADAAAAGTGPSYVEHPLLDDGVIERRLYQLDLVSTARNAHALVCLPTGLGKTTVSLLVTADRLHDSGVAPGGTVAPGDGPADAVTDPTALLLAPTKPLVTQHAAFYREALALPDDAVTVFTGEVSPDDRAALWDESRIVVATPQVIENDLIGGRITLRDVVHCTFDECHRASGDYAYNYIAERYHDDAAAPLVTGMSASPGGDEEAIRAVCDNLGVREIAVKTEADDDVAAHSHETEVEWERVDLPDAVEEIRDALNDVIADRLETLRECGVTEKTSPDLSQSDLNTIRGRLQDLIDRDDSAGYEGMSAHAEIMKLRGAVTLVETQSVEAVRRYFERQREAARSSGASKATQRMVSDPRVQRAISRAREFDGRHPKYERARAILAEALGLDGGERAIVFTESRDTAEALADFLDRDFDARRFVGQGDRDGSDGMTQTEQAAALDAFRDGEFDVLVSTSVAEEGLDVPEVDLVLFYEPVPTAIRAVQRKGRTGRGAAGCVVVLLAEDTRDEAYFWIAKRREEEMEDELRRLQGLADDLAQQDLDDFGTGGAGTADGEPSDAATASGGTTDAPPESSGATADGGSAGTSDTADAAPDGQPGLDAFAADGSTGDPDAADDDPADGVTARAGGDDGVEIVIDQRELDGSIARDLSARDGVTTRLETLAVGDYVLSDRVVVERKTVADFVDTLVGGDRSLFEQVGDAARAYARPVVVVEGDGLYDERNVHSGAIRGALASLAVDFGASVLRTRDADGTADLLETIANREQADADREVSVHGEKASKTTAEQQEYVVSAVADVGPVSARALLADLGSVEAVFSAERERLREVQGIGEVTADRIREIAAASYAPDG